MTLADVHALRNAIGSKTTLDTTPPSFTLLQIEDPTASNDRIEISFALNEPGTAYCRATLSDSGKIATDMPLVSKPVSLYCIILETKRLKSCCLLAIWVLCCLTLAYSKAFFEACHYHHVSQMLSIPALCS